MKIFRNLISVVLILVTTLLVSCGSPKQAKVPTVYSPEKIAQLQVFAEPIEKTREQLSDLKDLIKSEDWVDTRNLIHGPFGNLRQDMRILSAKLLPKDQGQAEKLAKEIFGHLERIDAAAKDKNATVAQNQYVEVVKDFDAFLNLIPQPSSNS